VSHHYHVCIPLDGGGEYTLAVCTTAEALAALIAALVPCVGGCYAALTIRLIPAPAP
jgi:hypothetical protein